MTQSLVRPQLTFRRTELSVEQIKQWLPHRPPLLLIDRVIDLSPPDRAVGIKNLSIADPVFGGHFPEDAIYPGVLLIETIAQLSGILLAACAMQGTSPLQEGAVGYLAGVRQFRFKRPARPGDQLRLEVTRRESLSQILDFHGEIFIDRQRIASGDVTIALVGAATAADPYPDADHSASVPPAQDRHEGVMQ